MFSIMSQHPPKSDSIQNQQNSDPYLLFKTNIAILTIVFFVAVIISITNVAKKNGSRDVIKRAWLAFGITCVIVLIIQSGPAILDNLSV